MLRKLTVLALIALTFLISMSFCVQTPVQNVPVVGETFSIGKKSFETVDPYNNQYSVIESRGTVVAGSPCDPKDQLWSKQWNMHAINLVQALKQFPDCNPSEVIIAIIDTGADVNHPDLVGNVANSSLQVDDSVEDIYGHGTNIAGIVGAVHNTLGIAGVHPQARLLINKYNGYDGSGLTVKDDYSKIAKLIKLAVDQGAKVINISLGASYDKAVNRDESDSTFEKCYPHRSFCIGVIGEAIRYAETNNVVIVVASGNTGEDGYQYPAAYANLFSNVIAVAASTFDNELATYSTTGNWITVSAPGGYPSFIPSSNTYQCLFEVDDCVLSLGLHGLYSEEFGTSQAGSHVTGVVGLMLSAKPGLTPKELRYVIAVTASPFANESARSGGSGIINAEAAVRWVLQR